MPFPPLCSGSGFSRTPPTLPERLAYATDTAGAPPASMSLEPPHTPARTPERAPLRSAKGSAATNGNTGTPPCTTSGARRDRPAPGCELDRDVSMHRAYSVRPSPLWRPASGGSSRHRCWKTAHTAGITVCTRGGGRQGRWQHRTPRERDLCRARRRSCERTRQARLG